MIYDLTKEIKSVEETEKRRQKDVIDMQNGLQKVLKPQCHAYMPKRK